MTFKIQNNAVVQRYHIRHPMPQIGAGNELFHFTGMVHFHGRDARNETGQQGESVMRGAGTMTISADYSSIIRHGRAIFPSQWTVLVAPTNFKSIGNSANATWAITDYNMPTWPNSIPAGNSNVFLANGSLIINTDVFLDGSSYIIMMSYDVSIIGKEVGWDI